MPAGHVGAQADRLAERLLGFVVALQLEVRLAELHEEGRAVDVERQTLRQHIQRLGRLAALHVDVAELEVGPAAARIELLRPFEADDGLVNLAGAR